MTSRIRVLFRGWTGIPHSYAMVNCFQLVHLYKNHQDKLDIYVKEMDYFREEWNSVKKLVYGDEYNNILQNLQEWKGEDVDIVYSITYPYDIKEEVTNHKLIPKCVFYTSEFAWIDKNYFSYGKMRFGDDNDITNHLNKYPNIYFTSPSVWSSKGITRFGIADSKNRIITHGVDKTIFKLHKTSQVRQSIRQFYNVSDDDILMINIGAMTQNKGIMLVLITLHVLVNMLNKRQYKLLLKGTQDLYTSKEFLEMYFQQLQADGHMTKDHVDNLVKNNIIFSTQTMTYNRINDLFNAADLYISPYLAEGFNLTVLESLSAGLPVIVPETGSTKEYIDDIYKNGGEQYIMRVHSEIQRQGDMQQNMINVNDLVNLVLSKTEHINKMKSDRVKHYDIMSKYMEENYSWNKVSELLYNYLKDTIIDTKLHRMNTLRMG